LIYLSNGCLDDRVVFSAIPLVSASAINLTANFPTLITGRGLICLWKPPHFQIAWMLAGKHWLLSERVRLQWLWHWRYVAIPDCV